MEAKLKILQAARAEFQEKGKTGARMQEIADRAEVNKALVHYYFKNKENLFQEVFKQVTKETLMPLLDILSTEQEIEEKVPFFVNAYMDKLKENPDMIVFMVGELQRNKLPFFPQERMGNILKNFTNQLQKSDQYKSLDTIQVLTTLIGACVFPFIARPLVSALSNSVGQSFDEFIELRKQELPKIILDGIRK
ncbi:TetR/AcrR family transcriptional regulator [Flammeovirga yaeyamensis]|uniref:TetR/AcrR family transcriptional regulator n=1 Tax=Flammeovirga yaeyamensis TaxID=367791 RepID=A0AAX1MYM5_9BACT|nr:MULTISPECIES: TetR/AcrR family transcriptional regulator [Flammeovirga]ANQ48150.1 TetR/AcrR family transcriptional regulator [Flammeovirga sp. MY04]MBB3696069.1 AcrR family transcriptional regulator [Flammeovirga yaeyamensis]NMF34754.1 TetR/AcrR family transcriptional regulator [Flammeovirga yaeyamensis]QWG00418.1 TetR/AcrR family transcriptional regulator [Flammeovirga yaeyamensis]